MKKVLTLSVLLLAASTLGTASALNTGALNTSALAAPTLATFASLKTPVGGPVTNRPIGAVTTARVFVNSYRQTVTNMLNNWKVQYCTWDEYIVTRVDGVEVSRTWDGSINTQSETVSFFAPTPSCPSPAR